MASAPFVGAPLITAETLNQRAKELGAQIDRDFFGREPVLISVLQGAMVFTADLIRSIEGHVQLGSIGMSSYPTGTTREEVPVFTTSLSVDVRGRDVVIVEDIVDTGHTVRMILDRLQGDGAASLTVATCLSKPSRRQIDVPVRYVGFEVPPVFVVGYGLDYGGRYRNLPYVGVLSETIEEEP